MFRKGSRSQSPESKCSVCLGDYKDKSYVPGCYHAFCFSCIKQWASRNNVCPLCKASFDRIIHKVKSETNYKEYVINVKKAPNLHDDYPFFFPSSSTLMSRLFRNNIQFQLYSPPTSISTSTLFEQTRVLRSNTSRRNLIIRPISLSMTRSRSRRTSHTVTIISDEENNTDTNTDTNTETNTETNSETNTITNIERPEPEVITLDDSFVMETPTPSTSGLYQSPSTSIQTIIISDGSDEEDNVEASNSNETVMLNPKSKKGKVSSKLKKKSSIDVAVQVGSTQNERNVEPLTSNVGQKGIKQKQNSKSAKMKHVKKKSKAESTSFSTDDDDLEVIQILSRKSSKKCVKRSVQTSAVQLNNNDNGGDEISICGVVSSSTGDADDNDCIFLMSKDNNVSININDNNNIKSVDINVNTDIDIDLNLGNNEVVESCNNIETSICASRENNIFVKKEDVQTDYSGCLVDDERGSLKRKCSQTDARFSKIMKE